MSIQLNDVQLISEVKGNVLVNVNGKFGQIDATLLRNEGGAGATGADGKSAYQIYVDNLGESEQALSESQWLESLKGTNGTNGADGKDVEITLADGHIKWRKTGTYEDSGEGWSSIIAISDIVNQVLSQINTVVENA